jgi:hypothetical protein
LKVDLGVFLKQAKVKRRKARGDGAGNLLNFFQVGGRLGQQLCARTEEELVH